MLLKSLWNVRWYKYEYLILDIFVTWRIYFKNFKDIATILMFYMPAKLESSNYSYLLCIEFVQNELDPCWEIYHTLKIKTFLFLERFTLPKYYCIRGMGYAKVWIFRGNKKEQVLDNLAEKNGQVSGSRIRGTSVSTWKKMRYDKNMMKRKW